MEWKRRNFLCIDTEDTYVDLLLTFFEGEIVNSKTIDEADVIIFVVDVEEGITPMDDTVAELLRKVKKPVYLPSINWITLCRRERCDRVYNLGLGSITLAVFQEAEQEICGCVNQITFY
jgi:GTP-binding protein